jgi:hypothetical protein
MTFLPKNTPLQEGWRRSSLGISAARWNSLVTLMLIFRNLGNLGRKLNVVIAVSVALVGVGCTLHGRIYNLTTGEVTPVTISYSGSGRGKISGVIASSGERVDGEYLTFAHVPVNWGSIYAKVYGTAGSAFTNAASLGKSNQYGTAVVTGNKGSVVDCEYVTTA